MNPVFAKIDRETGLSYNNGDYSFIPGTNYPSFLYLKPGLMSSANARGYILKKGERQIIISPSGPEQELKEVIDFLKQDLVVSNI